MCPAASRRHAACKTHPSTLPPLLCLLPTAIPSITSPPSHANQPRSSAARAPCLKRCDSPLLPFPPDPLIRHSPPPHSILHSPTPQSVPIELASGAQPAPAPSLCSFSGAFGPHAYPLPPCLHAPPEPLPPLPPPSPMLPPCPHPPAAPDCFAPWHWPCKTVGRGGGLLDTFAHSGFRPLWIAPRSVPSDIFTCPVSSALVNALPGASSRFL